MNADLRAALRLVVESHPTGSSCTLPRELVLELLDEVPAESVAPTLERDLSCRDLAEFIGRDPSTVRAMLIRGEFPGAYRLGKEWRVPPAIIRAWQEAQRAGKTPVKTTKKATVAGARHQAAPLSSWRNVSRERSR